MPCTCAGIGVCAYCDWNGFRNGHNKRGGGPRRIERDEAPEDCVTFIDQAEPFEREDFEAMFFNWQPRTESTDTDTEDKRPQMGDISMATKKPAKSAKKPVAAGSRAPGAKKTMGTKKKPVRAAK